MSDASGKYGISRPTADTVCIEIYTPDGDRATRVTFDEDAAREFTRDLVAIVLNTQAATHRADG